MRTCCRVLLASLCLLLPALAQAGPLRIYICAGQSNMVGPGQTSDLATIDASLLVPRTDVWCAYAGRVTGHLKPGYGDQSGNFGPELKFGHVVGDAIDDPILIFKSCIGGTTLFEDWRPPSTVAAHGGEVGYLYQLMVTRVKNLITHLDQFYPDLGSEGYELSAMLWFQGENDSIPLKFSQAYRENLVNFIHDVRQDLASPDLPVIIGEINDCGCWTHHTMIRAAQQYADEHIPNVSMIQTSDLDPGYHYDSASHVVIGQRFGKAALEIFSHGKELHLPLDGDLANLGAMGGAGTATGNPVFVGAAEAAVGSGALKLDGDDAVTMLGYKGVTGVKARTCSAWIRTKVGGGIMQWGAPTPGERWVFSVRPDGLLQLAVGGGGQVIGSIAVTDDQWHHVAAVSDTREEPVGGVLTPQQQTDDVELHVDGKLDRHATHASYAIYTGSSSDVVIGSQFDGLIDQVMIHDVALSALTGPPRLFKQDPPLAKVASALTPGLIGYWQFDEGEGTITMDAASHPAHGTLSAGVRWTEGKFGSAVKMENNQNVKMPNFSETLGSSGNIENLSVSFWLRTPLLSQTDILRKGDGYNIGWRLRSLAGDWGEVFATFDDGASGTTLVARSDWGDIAYFFGDGIEWRHVVFVYDGNRQVLSLYFDGIEAGLSPIDCSAYQHIVQSGQSLIVGGGDWSGAFGAVDELAIWGRALGEAEIATLYNDGKGVVLLP